MKNEVSGSRVAKIVITGPESTGKSELTRRLAVIYGFPYQEECARELLTPGAEYDLPMLRNIARRQFEERDQKIALLQQVATDEFRPVLFCDTDAVVLQIWALEKFDQPLPEATQDLRDHPADLYLLCRPDLPWEPDPLRENPHDRDRLFERYERFLNEHQLPYRIVEGQGDERTTCAVDRLPKFLK